MKHRLFFILITLALLTAGAVTLAAQDNAPPAGPVPAEEPGPDEDTTPDEVPAPDDNPPAEDVTPADDDKVALPDAPLADKEKQEEEPAPAEEKKEEVTAEVTLMQKFMAPGSFFMGFGIGGILPLANFETTMTFGYELFLNGHYRISEVFGIAALVAMTGVSRADGGTPMSFYNLGLGGRAYMPLSDAFFAWAELGLNGRTTNFADFVFGYHLAVCAGWLWSSDATVELGVEYDSTYTQTELYLKIFLAATFKL